MTAAGARLLTAVPGESAVTRRELPAGSRGLELTVWCSPVNGPGWCNWPGPLLGVHGFTVELEEAGEPAASASGPLLKPRPQSGIEPLAIAASDGDTGVRRVAVTLDGDAVGTLEPADGCRADRMPPCPQALRGTIDVDTRLVPDGARRLRLAVTDAAGNARTVDVGRASGRQPAARATRPGPSPATGRARSPRPRRSRRPRPDRAAAGVPGRAVPAEPARRPRPRRPTAAARPGTARLTRLAGAGPQPLGRAAAAPRGDRPVRRPRSHPRPPDRPLRPRIGRATLAAIRREPGGRGGW